MNVQSLLVHNVRVDRPTHTVVAGKKVSGTELVSAAVSCRIAPQAETFLATGIGRTAIEPARAWFGPTADVLEGDVLTWTDRTPPVVFDVLTSQKVFGFEDEPNHIVATLTPRKV